MRQWFTLLEPKTMDHSNLGEIVAISIKTENFNRKQSNTKLFLNLK